MHIFIDETGTFTGQGTGISSPSLVGALVIPDSRMQRIYAAYRVLRAKLPKHNGEVKGRLLDESHVAAVVDILRRHHAIFEATVIDLGLHQAEHVEAHRQGSANGITINLTAQHQATLIEEAHALKAQLEAMPLQLYAQSIAMTELVYRTVKHASMYFSQREPRELEAFHWVVDAKGDLGVPTPWEEWWALVVRAWVDSKSRRDAFITLAEGNYSYMKRFGGGEKNGNETFDVNKLLAESLKFSKDADEGLELVDILSNASRRGLIGNMQKSGWAEVPKLMFKMKGTEALQLISLTPPSTPDTALPYADVVVAFRDGGRIMFSEAFEARTKV